MGKKVLSGLLLVLITCYSAGVVCAATKDRNIAGSAISLGMRGEEVRSVQTLLAETGFYWGDIDGVFGAQTVQSVKEFQQVNQLPANGVVDNDTFLHLQRYTSEPSRYGRSMTMRASAYTRFDPGNGSYTCRGNLLRKGLVAVDPGVIPLGTRLFIQGYGYAIADDIGGAIVGDRIDLAFENRSEALDFGMRRVVVYILD